jgi:hypothetical protein
MMTDASVHVMQISRGGGLKGVTGFPVSARSPKTVGAAFFVSTVSPDSETRIGTAAAPGVDRSCHRFTRRIMLTPTPTWTSPWATIAPDQRAKSHTRTFIAAEHPSQFRCA